MERVSAGERPRPDEIAELADARHPAAGHAGRCDAPATARDRGYLPARRQCASTRPFADTVSPAAREVRLTGAPDTLDGAVAVTAGARTVARARTVSRAFRGRTSSAWRPSGITSSQRARGAAQRGPRRDRRAASRYGCRSRRRCRRALSRAGFEQLRLTIDKAPPVERPPLLLQASALQQRFGCIHAINPLPAVVTTFRPTTGYDDVKTVAIARLAAPNVANVQVDWLRYGPKLAQVALTFGADDLDGVTAVRRGSRWPASCAARGGAARHRGGWIHAGRTRRPLSRLFREPTVRLGAVGYLNARPLTWALDRSPERWQVRYDVPSVCSALLHAGEVDLGLIPSVEYLQSPDYRLVPQASASDRAGRLPRSRCSRACRSSSIRRIALDTSSRTSVALVKVLCRHRFRIEPEFVPHGPDLAAMTREFDAALLIGDPALDADHAALGPGKDRSRRGVDGDDWTALRVCCVDRPPGRRRRCGRAGAAGGAGRGRSRASTRLRTEYGRGNAAATARAAVYLRHNVRYGLGPDEARGLQMFLDYAAELGLAPRRRTLEFF